MRRIKITATTIALLLSFSAPGLAAAQTAPLSIMAIQGQSAACSGLDQLGGTSCDNNGNTPGQNQIATVAKTIVNIISFITGIAAVIMIVVAGVRFIASGGDSQATAGAKNMLIYAIIGLVVVALAQAIVHFVLNALIAHNVTQNPPPHP